MLRPRHCAIEGDFRLWRRAGHYLPVAYELATGDAHFKPIDIAAADCRRRQLLRSIATRFRRGYRLGALDADTGRRAWRVCAWPRVRALAQALHLRLAMSNRDASWPFPLMPHT